LDYLVHPLDRNIAGVFILTVFFTLLAILSGVPIVLCLFILLPITMLLKRLCACHLPSTPTHEKIAPIDSFWLNSGHITHCLLYIDKGLSIEQLRDVISTRLLTKPELIRFKSRLVFKGIAIVLNSKKFSKFFKNILSLKKFSEILWRIWVSFQVWNKRYLVFFDNLIIFIEKDNQPLVRVFIIYFWHLWKLQPLNKNFF